MLHQVWLAREKTSSHQIPCQFHFSAFDFTIKKVYSYIQRVPTSPKIAKLQYFNEVHLNKSHIVAMMMFKGL